MSRHVVAAALISSIVLLPFSARAEEAPVKAPEAKAPEATTTEPAAPAAPTEAKPAEAAATPAPTEQPIANGMLSVTSTPPGKVFIDDKDTGLVSPLVDFPVAPGSHKLRIVDAASGKEISTDFTMDAGGAVQLNLTLAEAAPTAAPAAPSEEKPGEAKAEEKPWTWMSVVGWTGLGLGTLSLVSGVVVLTSPADPDRDGPLGFTLFGIGAGAVVGGGVLLYLDEELGESSTTQPAPAATDKPAAPSEPAKPAASL